jgi:Fur family transcriptional regulator, stress-responsive regulator
VPLTSSRDFVAGLRDAGLRVTPVRLALLKLASEPGHHDAEYLMRAARERLGAISVQGVYDGLRALEKAGLVRRIQPAGGPSRFETRVGDNHHHVVCRGCGETDDVDCARGVAPCLEPSSSHGFVIDEAEVTYWGLCPSCQGRPTAISEKSRARQEASDD